MSYKVSLVTRTRVEVVVKDEDTDKIVTALREAALTGEVGMGRYSSMIWPMLSGFGPTKPAWLHYNVIVVG